MKTEKKLTPLMQQYWDIKSQHMDKVLLFRMGDFFEMFHDDAVTAAPILNIALTSRNKKAQDETPMCGMPHHSVAGPISKLLAAGHKVAICDQVEDPKEAKGIVKRAVTRILSPGMVYDPETLDQLTANFLCAYDESTMSFADASTGEAFYYRIATEEDRAKLISILSPVELVLSTKQKVKHMKAGDFSSLSLTAHDMDDESLKLSVVRSAEHSAQDELLESESASAAKGLPESAIRLHQYIHYMQSGSAPYMDFKERRLEKRMTLLPIVLRHLEVFKTYKGELKGSLFFAINRTKTSAGARLLKSWLQFPLREEDEINDRLNKVEFWTKELAGLKTLRQLFSQMGDIERRLGKISNPNCQVRDLTALTQSLKVGWELSRLVKGGEPAALATAETLIGDIQSAIIEDPPLNTKNGAFIRRGYDSDLDQLIDLAENGQKLLVEMEARERKNTGIPTLKTKYNNVFGYFLEVTHTHKNKVPDHYKRKQTLTNAERYITQELQELEDKILSSKSKRLEMEEKIFAKLRAEVLQAVPDVMALAQFWSELDVLSSLAWLSLEHHYVRPTFSKEGRLSLKANRHPVVEQEVKVPFVPNDLHLEASQCLLLTGPNMAGKSTIMRQVAVTALLAQVGSFVPSEAAELPIYDQIFTRIGASDYLAEGLSTFMVEMIETAQMLKACTENSLVILDEVGRGTSTYDGMSLAQSILEYLVTEKRPMICFATHYHEITQLERKFPQIKNVHMAIKEKTKDHEMSFLHTLLPGPANKSYGIHVARLAGIPKSVTQRAAKILNQLESFSTPADSSQLSLMDIGYSVNEEDDDGNEYRSGENPKLKEMAEELKEMSVSQLTPLEALNQLAKWQQELS